MTITRFAPSPTGKLHVGNLRTALLNYLFAKKHNGKFILRIDDTDKDRSKIEYENNIKKDLKNIGLIWDETFNQSTRQSRYNEIAEILKNSGRLYPCYETQEELELKKKTLLKRKLPPIYDRASLKLTSTERIELEKSRKPHWRFLLTDHDIKWCDLIKGDMHFNPKNISDPILFKEDGSMTYTLASIVDDMDYKITHILRGEDHLTNSAIHIQLFQALDCAIPQLGHFSLLYSKNGEISKRLGGFDIETLLAEGIEPMTLNSFLAKIGTSENIKPFYDIDELIASFNIDTFNKSPINYDREELFKLNSLLIHGMDYNHAKTKIPNLDENSWNVFKHNINTFDEFNKWQSILDQKFTIIDPDLIQIALKSLPQIPWNENTWHQWIKNIQQFTDKRGKDLFLPIRIALTGHDTGPDMKSLLLLIGYDRVIKKLT